MGREAQAVELVPMSQLEKLLDSRRDHAVVERLVDFLGARGGGELSHLA
jgi:hypothetical protein